MSVKEAGVVTLCDGHIQTRKVYHFNNSVFCFLTTNTLKGGHMGLQAGKLNREPLSKM